MKSYDAVVIGGGPAGITAAMYLARSACSVLMCEQLAPGGQVLMTDFLENYPGHPKGVKGYELADLFIAHLENLPVDRVVGAADSVTGPAGKFITRCAGHEYAGKTVLACTGARHRALGLEREDELIGRGVSYCALCDGNFFRGQTVAVVGGGNSALEEALYLSKIAGKVYLIHRREMFRGSKIFLDRLKGTANVAILPDTIIAELHGDSSLTGLTLRNVRSGLEQRLPIDGLFVYVGIEPATDFLPAELQRDAQGFILTDVEMRTSIPGIFAAGDTRSKLCRQVITAAGDGATAAQAAFIFLEQL
ncbi:MAG: FAD-dependent oxidoreductase [Desulfovibrio sp.]|jgi:thioredoxin reductase (NADPH)|nr:FAD-dependent oxidoreductase [Desulfovibrio sp.]